MSPKHPKDNLPSKTSRERIRILSREESKPLSRRFNSSAERFVNTKHFPR